VAEWWHQWSGRRDDQCPASARLPSRQQAEFDPRGHGPPLNGTRKAGEAEKTDSDDALKNCHLRGSDCSIFPSCPKAPSYTRLFSLGPLGNQLLLKKSNEHNRKLVSFFEIIVPSQ